MTLARCTKYLLPRTMPNGSIRCPSLPVSVRRASRRQGQAAPRWPPASLDSSYALRDRQLREEQGENRPAPKEIDFLTKLALFKINCILPGYPNGYRRRKPWHATLFSSMTLTGQRVLKQSPIPSTDRSTKLTCQKTMLRSSTTR